MGVSACICVLVSLSHAFPNQERASISLGVQTPTAVALDQTNHRLYMVAGETLSVIDLGTYAAATDALLIPYDISTDDDLQGALQGVAVNATRDELYATQDGGFLLTYDLAELSTAPAQTTLEAGDELTFLASDDSASILYIYNESDRSVIVMDVSSNTSTTVPLTIDDVESFTVNAMRFVDGVSGGSGALYLSTDVGRLFVLAEGATAASVVTVDSEGTDDLTGLAATPTSATLYIVNDSDKVVHTMTTSDNAVSGSTIDISANSSMSGAESIAVTNPDGTYVFILGSLGLSVIDTNGNDVLDLNESSEDDNEPLTLTSSGVLHAHEDEHLYAVSDDLTVISDNPFVTISSTSFANGGSGLGLADTLTMNFQADELGDYTLRLNGDAGGSGDLLTDTNGSATGTIAAVDTDEVVTIDYADHAADWIEGTNQIFVFVEDAEGNTGRRAVEITVDTPPPLVVIDDLGFGDGRAYVTVDRLTQSDIATYRVYADLDAATVLTKDTVAASAAQADSGDTQVIEVSGLSNGSTFFIAVEAVDAGGNVSAARTATINGVTASILPEAAVGPAGLSGETGCTLIPEPRRTR